MDTTDIDPLLGRTVGGKFELRELLGVGAMGKVYRAHHEGLDKAVAIKVLMPMPAVADAQARRFKAEARAASRLEHPNSVQIYDYGEAQGGLLYIAMELVEGEDLHAVIGREGPQPTARVAWVMSQVLSALSAAHARDVVHRDVKPGNIMLVDKDAEDGRVRDFVKVCDFGLAKILDPAAQLSGGPLTAQGAVFGTPAYMSPEQAQGAPVDARSDVYSCGVVTYKMITGHTPFRSETPTGVLLGHIHEPPPPLSSWGIDVDPRLAAIVERAMQKRPEDRFESAREARDALRSLLEDDGLSLPPSTGAAPVPTGGRYPPTEQVRLRGDQEETVLDRGPTTFARPRATSALSTVYGDTLSPEDAARVRGEARPLQTYAPLPPSGEDWARPKPGLPAWALGLAAIALVAAGAVLTTLWLGAAS